MSRTYNVNGVDVPSVTTVTHLLSNPYLMQWAVNCAIDHLKGAKDNLDDELETARYKHKEVLDEAAELGTEFHGHVEDWLKAGCPDTSKYIRCCSTDQIDAMVKSTITKLEKHHVEPIYIERFVSGDGYAGTLDLIAEVDADMLWTPSYIKKHGEFPCGCNRPTALIDLKTSGAYYLSHKIQLAAYGKANHGVPLDAYCIVRADKDSLRCNVGHFTHEIPKCSEMFDLLLKLYQLIN